MEIILALALINTQEEMAVLAEEEATLTELVVLEFLAKEIMVEVHQQLNGVAEVAVEKMPLVKAQLEMLKAVMVAMVKHHQLLVHL